MIYIIQFIFLPRCKMWKKTKNYILFKKILDNIYDFRYKDRNDLGRIQYEVETGEIKIIKV